MTATIARTAKKKPVAHVDQLAADLADARNERKKWEQREAELAEKLLAAHSAGIVPTKFATHGWSFVLQSGRETVVYPEPTLAAIKDLQAEAITAGQTTVRVGSPFWRVTAAKEAD